MEHFKVEAAVKVKDIEVKKGAGESASPCLLSPRCAGR
jgi:hypothetical protein